MTKQEILDQIAASITANGLQKINAAILNTVLTAIAQIIPDDSMLTSSYGGIVEPGQTIPTVSGKGKWFIAKAGLYTNYGGFTFLAPNFNILSYNGTSWEKTEIPLPEPQNNSEKWQTINRNSSTININYNSGSNVKINGLTSGDTITFSNLPSMGSICLYVETTLSISSLNIAGVIWQNGAFPALESGKGYYILLTTYNGGTVKLGTVTGAWPLVVFKAQDTFETSGTPTTDEKNNNYLKSNGDAFLKSNGYLTLQTKVSSYPLIYVDLNTSNYTAIAKCDGSGTQGDLIANVRFLTNGFTFYFITVLQNKTCVFGYVLDGAYQGNYGSTVNVPNVDLNNYEMSIKRTGTLLEFFLDGVKLGESNDGNAGTNQYMNYGIMLPDTAVKVKEIYAL